MSLPTAITVFVVYENFEDKTFIEIKALDSKRMRYGIKRCYANVIIENMHDVCIIDECRRVVSELGEEVHLTSNQIRFLEGSLVCAFEAHIDNESNNSG
jgi:hypothetical protein